MNRSKLFLVLTLVLLALGLSTLASATPITLFVATVTSTDPTQLGRISRNNVPSDWSGPKAFPGFINTTTAYYYSEYVIPNAWFDFGAAGYAGYVQVDIDSISANSFGSAYLGSYDPSNPSANYLGDPGSSGNYFGTDPLFYQFYLPQGDDLVLVFNNTSAAGVGDSLNITVEGFLDTQYTDPATVPEPASLMLLGTGILALGRGLRKRL